MKRLLTLSLLLMFSFANGQDISEEEREKLKQQQKLDEAYNQLEKEWEAEQAELKEDCSEAQDMANKYRELSMNERNMQKQSVYVATITANATYYLAFCKD